MVTGLSLYGDCLPGFVFSSALCCEVSQDIESDAMRMQLQLQVQLQLESYGDVMWCGVFFMMSRSAQTKGLGEILALHLKA
jgi:hypothetical protein